MCVCVRAVAINGSERRIKKGMLKIAQPSTNRSTESRSSNRQVNKMKFFHSTYSCEMHRHVKLLRISYMVVSMSTLLFERMRAEKFKMPLIVVDG